MSSLRCLLLVLAFLAVSEQGQVQIPRGDYNVEVYFVMDEKSQETYMKEENNDKAKAKASMTGDLNYFITELNTLFTTLYKTKLTISVRGLDFISGNTFKSKNLGADGKIGQDEALADFEDWLKTTGAKAKYKYDVAILYTGYNFGIKADNYSTVGLAYFEAICSEQSTGIVEYDKTWGTVGTTAHEIAHILGADHDPKGSNIMAPSSDDNALDRWWFSLGSAEYIWKIINNLNDNCMLKASPDSTVPHADVTPALIDANKLCKRAYGSKYYINLAKHAYNNSIANGDIICVRFYCTAPGDEWYNVIYTSTGMPCAKGKTCKEGSCQDDPNSKAAAAIEDDKCVFGDQELVSNKNLSCAALVAKQGKVKSCGTEWFTVRCCATASTMNCAQYSDASCPKDKPIKCPNSANCLHSDWMCDNMDDCGDNWDESNENCPTTSNKRSLIDILLDKTLDKRGMIAALESLRDKTVNDDIKDEAPKTPKPKPNQSTEKREVRSNIA